MQYRLLLIDVDGTAVLSEDRNRAAIEDVAREGGFIIHPEDWNDFAGAGDEVIWDKIQKRDPEFKNSYPTAESFENACIEAYSKRISEVTANDAVLELVRQCKAQGILVGAVSNSLNVVVRENLTHTGYPVEELDVIICKDDVRAAGKKTKPAPDPYHMALGEINAQLPEGVPPIKPEECLILEDSKTGARSGLKFGATLVQLIDESDMLPPKEAQSLTKQFNSAYHACALRTLPIVVAGLNNLPQQNNPLQLKR